MNDHLNENVIMDPEVVSRIRALEDRLTSLEARMNLLQTGDLYAGEPGSNTEEDEIILDNEQIEMKFGEFGLAWLGNIVLFFGIIFLSHYFQRTGDKFISAGIGYLAVIGIFWLANYFRSVNTNMASTFKLNGYLLLYFFTLRLHFFTDIPILTSLVTDFILLLAVSVGIGYIAIRNKSQGLMSLAALMMAITAVVVNSTYLTLSVASLIAIASVYFWRTYGWNRLLNFSIVLVYLIHLVWILNNPFMNHTFEIIKDHQYGFMFLFLLAMTYSLMAIIPSKIPVTDKKLFNSMFLNGSMFSLLITVTVLAFFEKNLVPVFAPIGIFCLVYSIWLQKRSFQQVITSLYALYSFLALSVMIYGIYGLPKAYFLWSVQSLLVVSIALWFRSRTIVRLNIYLYLVLLTAYLASSKSIDIINFSFALVALLSARIINWKKKKLEIKTELMRNTYLACGFFMFLLAFYHAVPGRYVSLSWTIAALIYFGLSILINNVKYRYLALASMLAAAVYLFVVDLANVEIIFRVVALLFLAVISIVLSLYYIKKLKKNPGERIEQQVE